MHNRKQRNNQKVPVQGRHLPQMAADKRRAQQNKRSDRYRPKPVAPVTADELTWGALLLLLIVCPAVAAETRVLDFVVPEMRIHNQPVARLPANAACKLKAEGISQGKICDVKGQTYFLKSFPIFSTKPVPGDKTSKRTIVVQEEFNRQLMRKAGVRVPQTQFFKQVENSGQRKLYIGTEKIAGIQFADGKQVSDKELGPKGVAKLAVASTLIADLHDQNYGWDANGLVLIDTDGVNTVPGSIDIQIGIAEYAIENTVPPLSLYDLRQMVKIYEKMRAAGLPEFHEEFGLTNERYAELLNIYIKTCQQTLAAVHRLYPNFSSSQPHFGVNSEWNNQLRSIHPPVIANYMFGGSSVK
jgi:hypothetical protein